MRPILDVGADLGLGPEDLSPFGDSLAKLRFETTERLMAAPPRGKLVLVSAMTPTKFGEGKTTCTIGLLQALRRRGHRVSAALREPSLGPIFGAKGGGTGGGKTTMEPSARINLHGTGDLHAIAAANNLLSALVDHAMHFRREPVPHVVTWRRCIDMNDRTLRQISIGLGGKANGVPREDGFNITAASEVMAALCLASGVEDLRARLGRILVGYGADGAPISAGDLGASEPMAALLYDAILPNLAQSTDGAPILWHGGPFGNIAHGCNSIRATRAALALSDVVLTEAGFGFDLGGEKFLHLKCRAAGLWPQAVVVIVTVRAVRAHAPGLHGAAQLEAGFANVARHVASVRAFGLEPVVGINVFADDTEADLSEVERLARALGVPVGRTRGFALGAEGAEPLAAALEPLLRHTPPAPKPLYAPDADAVSKLEAIARQVYGADGVDLTAEAREDLARAEAHGFGKLGICMAKTHLSLSDDPTKVGAPVGFRIRVRRIRVSAGAGFLLALTGDIMTMPGLPREPHAPHISLGSDGRVRGVT